MPQPVDLQSWSRPRRAVLERPACAVQIAATVGEWAYVEEMLTLMFSASMGTHSIDDDGSAHVNRNWTALATMRELESLHMRLRVVEKTLVPLLPTHLEDQWDVLKKKLRKCAQQRNIAAHATWGLSDRYPQDLIREDEKGRTIRHTPQDFADVVERISTVCAETYAFMRAVLDAQRAGNVRSPQ